MKMYVKPSIEVIELQLKENIAAVPTTVYKGKNVQTSSKTYALNAANSGLNAATVNNLLKDFGGSLV